MEALFPRYFAQLKSAGFLPAVAGRRAGEAQRRCAREASATTCSPSTSTCPDASDAQIAETFFHHRVLLLPVVDDGQVVGVIIRRDFFRALAERFLEAG